MDPLTPKVQSDLLRAVDDAAKVAELFLPQFGAYIVLGRALAKAAPSLYNDAVRLLSRVEPTAEDKADLARKVHALANPESA